MNRPYFLTPGYKSEIEETRQGVYRVVVPASQSAIVGAPASNTITTLSVSGRKIVFPRSENELDMQLAIWPGNVGTSTSPIILERGGTFENPFKENVIRVGYTTRYSNATFVCPTSQLVLYVADRGINNVEPASDEILTTIRAPASGYFASSDSLAGTTYNLASSRFGFSAYTSPPTNTDAANFAAFRIGRVNSITFCVLDGNATPSTGTVLRPWWYLPGLLQTVNSNVAGAGDGWVPDGMTYTVGSIDRIFTMQINVRLGFSPTWMKRADGSGDNAANVAPRFDELSGAMLTFQASSIPVGAEPRLIITGEVMP